MAALAHLSASLLVALALSTPPTTAANRALAHRDAEQLLGLVVLPSGARTLGSAPGRAGGLLGRPFQIPSGKLVDRHRLWQVDEPLASVLSFVEAHAPRGTQREGTGSGSAGGPHYPANKTLTFAFPARSGRISLRWLSVTMVALPHGTTAVRADAQDIWVVTRPPSERLPSGVREIDVGRRRVTDGATVATIVRWFDALPIVQPGVAYHCPAMPGGSPTVRLAFRGANGTVLARASLLDAFHGTSSPCNPISFSIGGRRQTPLVGGDFLIRVERLLRGRRPQSVVSAPHRPRDERVPDGVRSIAITSAAGVSAYVGKRATIDTIVRWFDALPRFVPLPCPLVRRIPPTVTFVFRGPGLFAKAVDREPGTCPGRITFTNDLDVAYPLLADDGFVARVSRLLGVDFDPDGKTAANERQAGRDASSLLRLAAVPAGSVRVTKPPNARFALPAPASTGVADRHRIWKVHESVDQVFAFEKSHRPAGSRLTGTGASDYGPSPSENLLFSFPPLAGRISSRVLDVSLVPLGDGWTGMRVDAQDVWVAARRPRGELLPAGVRSIAIAAPKLTKTVTDPARVATIVRWFDALPVVPRGLKITCPLIAGPPVRLAFDGAGGRVLARAAVMYLGGLSSPCNPIHWSAGGRTKTPLDGGRFLRRVESLLGRRLG